MTHRIQTQALLHRPDGQWRSRHRGDGGRTGRRPSKLRAVLTGRDALGDWTTDAPGVRRKITVDDLPGRSTRRRPTISRGSSSGPKGRCPARPRGFRCPSSPPACTTLARSSPPPMATSSSPRACPAASSVLRDADGDGKAETSEDFATGLTRPFGIAFYPPGPNPTHIYVGNTDSVVRFPYQNGDTKARGPAEVDRQEHPDRPRAGWRRRPLDPRPRVLAGRQDPVRLGRLALERQRRRERETPGRHPGLRPRRHERADLRLGHPQRRRPGDPPADRPALGLGQRARRPGRPPGARLRHPRRGRRLLRLALVLPRPPSGPAAQGQAPRAQGQGDRARRAASSRTRPRSA